MGRVGGIRVSREVVVRASRRRPALFYDADCGFCRRWIARWSRTTGDRVRYLPYQQRGGMSWRYAVSRRAARSAVQLVEPDGRRYSGAQAVFRILLRSRSRWVRLAARGGLFRVVRRIADAAYRYVAVHRRAFSRAERMFMRVLGPSVPRRRFWVSLSRPGLAVNGLGIVYLVAFASLKKQVLGLYGARGILPIQARLQDIDRALRTDGDQDGPDHRRVWWQRFRLMPSLLWLDASDAGLRRLCTIGEIAGAALALGLGGRLGRRLMAATAWAAYLRSSRSDGTSCGSSGTCCCSRLDCRQCSADHAACSPGCWRSACSSSQGWPSSLRRYHLAQPQRVFLPPGDAAVAHAHRLVCAPSAARAAEGRHGVDSPGRVRGALLAFGPRRLRQPAFAILTAFQGLIALTGNYAFFNWLTALLNLGLLELPSGDPDRRDHQARQATGAILETMAAAPVFILGFFDLVDRLRPDRRRPAWAQQLADSAAPFHVVSSYGLFSAMTTERPEIVIEGSDDGESWQEYGFRYKPGDVSRAPRWVAPHQPRLDWQMWFAALGDPPAWFPRLLQRLLEGSPEVLALLDHNPFPARPPRFVRALLYDYRMTDLRTRRQTGSWWVRTKLGTHFPVCTLTPPPAARGRGVQDAHRSTVSHPPAARPFASELRPASGTRRQPQTSTRRARTGRPWPSPRPTP